MIIDDLGNELDSGDDTTITHQITSEDQIQRMSYYTVCRLSDKTHCGSVKGIILVISREYKGILTTDGLGNYISLV